MPSATTHHVPAWKRLGLKLKSANEDADSITISDVPIALLKRKRPDIEDVFSSRKAKRFDTTASESLQTDPITPSLSRKKSVTFTPETKVDDGDSIKQLFNSWAAEQKAQDPSFDFKSSAPVFSTPSPSTVHEQIDPKHDEKERRVNRVQKSRPIAATAIPKKKQKLSKVTKATKATTPNAKPFLRYLKQYSESRDTWKFNKNHQTHLLKHIFDINVVPSDHIHLAYTYIRGLQGTVRTRLRDETLTIKIKDSEEGFDNMADPEKAREEYEIAMREYVATKTAANLFPKEAGYEEGILVGLSDIAMKNRVGKRVRAETVLENLGDVPVENGESMKKLKMNDGSSQKIARKRKQRTAVEETDSSDSSSDEDDSSTAEDTTTQNEETDDEDSSSSSSSSSSSEGSSSEDDDDSEEGSEDGSDDGQARDDEDTSSSSESE